MCFQLTICVSKLILFLTLSYLDENPLNFWTKNFHRWILIWFPVSGFLQKFDKLMISRPVTEIMHFEIETWKLLNFNLVIRCLFPRFKSWKFRNFWKLLSYPAWAKTTFCHPKKLYESYMSKALCPNCKKLEF